MTNVLIVQQYNIVYQLIGESLSSVSITSVCVSQQLLVNLNKTDVQPFLILSDINMPKINGFELRNKIFTNQQLQTKCIPYLFFTTSATKMAVIDAYALSVQGFFIKKSTMQGLENTIKIIVDYWLECIAPSQYD